MRFFSHVFLCLLSVMVACGEIVPGPAPAPSPIVNQDCPLFSTGQEVQDRCCFFSCKEKEYRADAYKSCAVKVVAENSCSVSKQIILEGQYASCRCY